MSKDSYREGTTMVAWPLQARTVEGLIDSLEKFRHYHEYVPRDAEVSMYESFGECWISVRWSG